MNEERKRWVIFYGLDECFLEGFYTVGCQTGMTIRLVATCLQKIACKSGGRKPRRNWLTGVQDHGT